MRLWIIGVLAACSGSSSDDVVGPFTGEVRRFAIDSITVPHDSAEADWFAADLDGDGKPENQLGLVTAVLASTNDLSSHGPDMIAGGGLASSIEIQADSLDDDGTVGVRYFGAAGDTSSIEVGGRIVAGAFVSNRTAETGVPGRALARLPVYVNADPLVIELEGMELELAPDGRGGYDGIVRGGVREASARAVAYAGFVQMLETEPERHLVFARQIDTDGDGAFSQQELDDSVIALLVTGDVRLFEPGGDRFAPGAGMPDSLSLAFGVHLVPCPTGTCATAPPADPCRDRVRDGDESDVDCGGSCQPCFTARLCSAPADCQSNACTAGSCGAPSCSDGVRDGYESDIDCGGICGVCAAGETCAADTDCATASCSNGIGMTGTCAGP